MGLGFGVRVLGFGVWCLGLRLRDQGEHGVMFGVWCSVVFGVWCLVFGV